MTQERTPIWTGAWEGGVGLLPTAAVIAGLWAQAPPSAEELPRAALAVALVLAGWMPLWRALTGTEWARALRAWPSWKQPAPLPPWPYLQPGTPGARLHRALALFRGWWQALGSRVLAIPLRVIALSLVVSLLLGAALGREALLFSFLVLTWAELSALWNEGRGETGALGAAVAAVGLPWLLGLSVRHGIEPVPALSVLALIAVAAGQLHPAGIGALGSVLGALFLLWLGEPVATGLLLLLAFPGLLFALRGVRGSAYRRAVAPWLIATLLLFAGVL